MNKILSVIIPVYNTEKYVEQCVRSVLNQPQSETVEIVLVDDGSTDSSCEICDKLANEDKRVHVFHQKNSGQASARNNGLNNANGKYVVFLDSDDFWSDNTLPDILFYVESTQKDMYLFSVQSYRNGKKTECFFDAMEYKGISEYNNGQAALKFILAMNYNYGWCPIWYIIKRQLLIDNNLVFPQGFLCEDVYFSFRLWCNVKTIQSLPVLLYNYRRDNQTSTTHIASFKFAADLLEMCRQNLEFATNNISDNSFMDLIKLNIQTLVEVVIIYYSRYSTEEREKLKCILNQLKEIYNLCDNNRAKSKEKLISLLIKIFGFRVVSYIWRLKLVFQ